jgi:THAP4-like, heme-binding beta-barrel domain
LFVLPEGLQIELTPLSFLVGKWEGSGVIVANETEYEFHQRIEFSHDGQGSLTYVSTVSLDDEAKTQLPSELGYWRIARPREAFDHGPALIPGVGETTIKTHEDLERYRNETKGFDLEVSTLHPGGVAELYTGYVKQAQIHLASAHGVAFEGAKTYRHSTRIYGLVEGALLWAWDIALPGGELKSHASARLERVE